MNPDRPGPNVFFRKASSSLSGANDVVLRPKNVQLLDYEIELAVVVGRAITSATGPITSLGSSLAGVVILNDVSARDIQLPEGQPHLLSSRTLVQRNRISVVELVAESRSEVTRLEERFLSKHRVGGERDEGEVVRDGCHHEAARE